MIPVSSENLNPMDEFLGGITSTPEIRDAEHCPWEGSLAAHRIEMSLYPINEIDDAPRNGP